MTKYSKDILLTSSEENSYRTTRFTVSECDTPAEADKKLLEWIRESPELLKIAGNKKIIDTVIGQ